VHGQQRKLQRKLQRAFDALVRCDPEEQCEDGKEVNHIPGEPEEIHGAVLLSQVSG
jgi:hypothetical protein